MSKIKRNESGTVPNSCGANRLRDTDQRVLDVAVKYGFSSQEVFTRAFNKAFQLTPAAYQKAPRPIRVHSGTAMRTVEEAAWNLGPQGMGYK